jgi:hypothetical protein
LSKLLKETAAEVGIPDVSDQGHTGPYEDVVSNRRTRWIYVTWAGADVASDEDDIERIEVDKLQVVGEALALALTKVVRQSSY